MTKKSQDYIDLGNETRYRWNGVMPKDVTIDTDWTCSDCTKPVKISYGRLQSYHMRGIEACKCRHRTKKPQDYIDLGIKTRYKWLGVMPKNASRPTDWTCPNCNKPVGISYDRLQAYHKQGIEACKCKQLNARVVKQDYIDLGIKTRYQWNGVMPRSVALETGWTCLDCQSPIRANYNRLQQYYQKGTSEVCPCRQNGPNKPETRIYTCLSGKGLTVIQQHEDPRCRNINSLPFDAYISSLDLYIEFDGLQHYDRDYCENRYHIPFEYRVRNDRIKSKFAGDKLIRIPCWDEKRIEEILEATIFDAEARKLYQEEVKRETLARYPEVVGMVLNLVPPKRRRKQKKKAHPQP